jgi:hypothetical protein
MSLPSPRDLKDFLDEAFEFMREKNVMLDIMELVEEEYDLDLSPKEEEIVYNMLRRKFGEGAGVMGAGVMGAGVIGGVAPVVAKKKAKAKKHSRAELVELAKGRKIPYSKKTVKQLREALGVDGAGRVATAKDSVVDVVKGKINPHFEEQMKILVGSGIAKSRKKEVEKKIRAAQAKHPELDLIELHEKLGAGFFTSFGKSFVKAFNTVKDVVSKSAPIVEKVATALGLDEIAKTANTVATVSKKVPKLGSGDKDFARFKVAFRKHTGHSLTKKQADIIREHVEGKHGGAFIGAGKSIWDTMADIFNGAKKAVGTAVPIVSSVLTAVGLPELKFPVETVGKVATLIPDIKHKGGQKKKTLKSRVESGKVETEAQGFNRFVKEFEKRSKHKLTAKQKAVMKKKIEERLGGSELVGGAVVGGSFWSSLADGFKKGFNTVKSVAATALPIVGTVLDVVGLPEVGMPLQAVGAIAKAVPDLK